MSEKFSLKGRTALVTGGARGIGFSLVQGLAEAGADVAVFDIIEENPEFRDMSSRYGVKTKFYYVDVSNTESLQKGFDLFVKDFNGKLDICVPCAGINRNVSFLDTSMEEHQKLLNVNVLGAYHTAQFAAKQMIKNGTKNGSLIMIASLGSHVAIKSQGSSAYCGTKGAIKAMVPQIACELRHYNIRVNSISPGYIATEMTAPYPELMEGWKSQIMFGRVGLPADVSGACVFLASHASSYMTGQDIVIDGGATKW